MRGQKGAPLPSSCADTKEPQVVIIIISMMLLLLMMLMMMMIPAEALS